MSDKPIIRHCNNCQYYKILSGCAVKYKPILMPRLSAIFCRFYKVKKEFKERNTGELIKRIVERLEEVGNYEVILRGGRCNGKTLALGYKKGIENAIEIVKEEGGEWKD